MDDLEKIGPTGRQARALEALAADSSVAGRVLEKMADAMVLQAEGATLVARGLERLTEVMESRAGVAASHGERLTVLLERLVAMEEGRPTPITISDPETGEERLAWLAPATVSETPKCPACDRPVDDLPRACPEDDCPMGAGGGIGGRC